MCFISRQLLPCYTNVSTRISYGPTKSPANLSRTNIRGSSTHLTATSTRSNGQILSDTLFWLTLAVHISTLMMYVFRAWLRNWIEKFCSLTGIDSGLQPAIRSPPLLPCLGAPYRSNGYLERCHGIRSPTPVFPSSH